MNGDLAPYIDHDSGSLLPSFLERRTKREIARIKARSAVVAAHESAKIAAIENVAEHALIATGRVSGVEALMVVRTPHAAARLQHIADSAATSMSNVVMGMGR